MKQSRELLRAAAKKLYKEQAKSVPKKQRMPFSAFFKKYVELHEVNPTTQPTVEEDFDINQVVNVNDISASTDDETNGGNNEQGV